VTIGEVNTLRLWSRLEVMLCRGESFGIPLMTRCVVITCAVRVWLGLRLFSVLTRLTEGLGVCFWGVLAMVGGGFANRRFP
jgi:hypothetical protein